MNFDTSTINKTLLKRLPIYKKPATYRISDYMGSVCAGDPPGYPSYFIQDIHTQYGNSPSKGAQSVIFSHVLHTAGESYENVTYRLRKLWVPLPYEHERVQAWIADTYRHMHNCYYHPDYTEYGKPAILTGPSRYSKNFGLKTFTDDPRFSEEWRTKAMAEVEVHNAEVYKLWSKVAQPENHAAYQFIKKYYDQHEPDLELIANPPEIDGNWWETYDHRPTPEECPGTARWGRPVNPHPVNGSWCQVCGWRAAAL